MGKIIVYWIVVLCVSLIFNVLFKDFATTVLLIFFLSVHYLSLSAPDYLLICYSILHRRRLNRYPQQEQQREEEGIESVAEDHSTPEGDNSSERVGENAAVDTETTTAVESALPQVQQQCTVSSQIECCDSFTSNEHETEIVQTKEMDDKSDELQDIPCTNKEQARNGSFSDVVLDKDKEQSGEMRPLDSHDLIPNNDTFHRSSTTMEMVTSTQNATTATIEELTQLPPHRLSSSSPPPPQDIEQQQQLQQSSEFDQSNGTSAADVDLNGDESSPMSRHSRVAFLDNLKIFLTALVVSHHVSCSFGGCGDAWYLVAGVESTPWFDTILRTFTMWNQAYFMPLFFFISAYFVPASYAAKGEIEFLKIRRRRLYIPFLCITFVIMPLTYFGALASFGYVAYYFPTIGHGWFLLWLLLLNAVYCTVQRENPTAIIAHGVRTTPGDQADQSLGATNRGAGGNRHLPALSVSTVSSSSSTNHEPTTGERQRVSRRHPVPGTRSRWCSGLFVCGFLMMVVVGLERRRFGSMPITIGSLTCDLFAFALGTQAKDYGWLLKPLEESMDISPRLLYIIVILEAIGLALLLPTFEGNTFVPKFAFFLIAGVFCMDMSMAMVQIFQKWWNKETKLSRFLSSAAYTVYIIHPVVVVACTRLYIWVYNEIVQGHDAITFPGGRYPEDYFIVGVGGKDWLPLGWVLVNVASHLIVWPLAHGLRRLPGLRQIL